MKKQKPNREREIQIKFYVNKKEAEKIKKRARDFQSVSQYLRKISINGKVRVSPPSISLEHYLELNRIGNNINQIARKVNSSEVNPFHRKNKEAIERQLEELKRSLIINIEELQRITFD